MPNVTSCAMGLYISGPAINLGNIEKIECTYAISFLHWFSKKDIEFVYLESNTVAKSV